MKQLLPAWIRIPYSEDKLFGLVFFILLIATLFFFPYLNDGFEGPRMALLLVLIGSSLLLLARKQNITARISKLLLISLAAFVVWYVVSVLFSQDAAMSVIGSFARRSNSLVFILLWSLFIFLIATFSSEQKITTLARLLVVIGSLVAVFGVLQSFGLGYYAGLYAPTRPVIPGFEGNQNFSAMFLVGIIPLVLPLALLAKNNLVRISYGVATFIMLWALMIFASRGAILAFFTAMLIGLALWIIKRASWRITALILAGIVIAGGLAFIGYSSTRVPGIDTSLDLNTDISTVNRIQVWVEAVNLIERFPLTGLGPGNFIIGYKSLGNTSFTGNFQFDDPHNLYLSLASTVGLPALAIFLLIIVIGLQAHLKNFWQTGSVLQWGFLIAMLGLIISFNFNPVTIANMLLLGFLIAASQYNTALIIFEKAQLQRKIILTITGALFIVLATSFMTSEFLERATEHAYQAQQYQQTIKYGSCAGILNPFSIYPRVYETAAMVKSQQDPQSIRENIASLTQHHSHSAVNYQYAGTLSFMLYQNTQEQADLDSAYNSFAKANQLDANYSPLLTSYAYVAYKAGNVDLAEKLISQSLTLTTQSPNFLGHILLAEIQLEKGEFEAMAKTLQTAYDIQPVANIKTFLDAYKAGTVTAQKLPVFFPPVDII